MPLPDFIVAGARKCGTTWLHQYLASDADVFLPHATKELFFFDRYWERGVDWYANYFAGCPEGRLCGEVSPTYFNHPLAAKRMRETLPHVKLVFMFRNPVDRARSLYEHLVAKGDTRSSFEAALKEFPDFVDEGLYFKHLRRFEEEFGRDACQVLILEDIATHGDDRLRELRKFIGLPNEHVSMDARSVYEKRTPRSHFLAKTSTAVSRTLHHLGLHGAVRGIKALGVQRLVYSARRNSGSSISTDMVQSLQDFFREDVKKLGAHLGRDLSALWGFDSGIER